MWRMTRAAAVAVLTLAAAARVAEAQPAAATEPPPPVWTGSAAAGVALTRGNSDTTNVNLSYDIKRDPKDHFVFMSRGLYIWGDTNGEVTTSRLTIEARLDRKLSDRTSLFGQVQYLRDTFKEIEYLITPTAGIAHLLVSNDATELGVNASLGVVWEKNTGRDTEADGALNAGQHFKQKLSSTAEFTERVVALWKLGDFDDALYVFGVGVTAAVTGRTQLKFEVIDTYKNRPPEGVEKNDVSMLVSFVFKF